MVKEISLIDFIYAVNKASYSFKDKSFSLTHSKVDAESCTNIQANINFNNCNIIINNLSELITILKNNKRLNISIKNSKIFIKHCLFLELFRIKNSDLFKEFESNELFICNIVFEYNEDSINELDDFMSKMKEKDDKIICTIKCVFQYMPKDFSRFVEIVYKLKIQLIHFDFLYTSNQSETIPDLTIFSAILGELKIKNANINRKNLPFASHIYLINCRGYSAVLSRKITIDSFQDFKIRCLPGSNIEIKNKSNGEISCKGFFSIFFDVPLSYRDNDISILEGQIRKTNKKSLLEERIMLHKYQIFVNEDFSSDNKITKFYKCKFNNCFFGSNQQLLDCEFRNCYFSEGMEFVLYS